MSDEPDDAVKEFDPVWISSVEHVTTYVNAMKDTSFRGELSGDYGLPDEFPYMKTAIYWACFQLFSISVFLMVSILIITNLYLTIFFVGMFLLMGIILLSGRRKGSIHAPIPFFSSGELQIDKTRISFKAKPFSTIMWEYHNLDLELGFELSPSDIVEIERFDFHSGKRYNRKPVRIKVSDEILGGDFLLFIGGKGPRLGKMRKQTDLLNKALVDFKNSGEIEF